MMMRELKTQILKGVQITREEALKLINADLNELCSTADEIRKHYCGQSFDLCTIINGKSGRCSEDCKYCAQSVWHSTNAEEYPLLDTAPLLSEAQYNFDRGVLRYSVVTSGRCLSDTELNHICNSYRKIHEACKISLCASHGLLTYEQFLKLKDSGVSRYHNNLETSRNYFSKLCTTHTYDEKIATIRNARKAGLEVCSGGILGLGETMEDRIDMALELRSLGIRSVPVNMLNPIKGTPLEDRQPLAEDEVRRTVAIFRLILPKAAIRLAGGRGLLSDFGETIFRSGANAVITGDMLTTSGISIEKDQEMIRRIGFEVNMI